MIGFSHITLSHMTIPLSFFFLSSPSLPPFSLFIFSLGSSLPICSRSPHYNYLLSEPIKDRKWFWLYRAEVNLQIGDSALNPILFWRVSTWGGSHRIIYAYGCVCPIYCCYLKDFQSFQEQNSSRTSFLIDQNHIHTIINIWSW